MLIGLKQNGQSIYDCDSAQRQFLYNLSGQYNNIVGAYARSILYEIDTLEYIEQIIMPGMQLMFSPAPSNFSDEQNRSRFKLFPNPAKDYFIIDYKIGEYSDDHLRIEIINTTGKLVQVYQFNSLQNQKVIETKAMKQGVYFVRFISGNNVLETLKITILGR